MKKLIIGAVSVIFTLLWSSLVSSEPPPGVGSAVGSEGPCFAQVVVGPPGDFFPILDGVHGVLFVEVGEGKFVEANSARGTANLTCHGQNVEGQEQTGIDVVTGLQATGTAPSTEAVCSALETVGLTGACRGNGNAAIIVTAELQGSTCFWGDLVTLNWKSVFTPSGKNMTSCHFKD